MEVVEGTATVADVGAFVDRLDAIGTDHGATIQAFDARYVVDRAHLERAVKLATRAHDRGEGIADDFGVEILLYAAGRRQISQALEMGLSEGTCPVVAVVVGGDERAAAAAVADTLDPGETLGQYDRERVQSFFDVSEGELTATEGTLADAVRERVALLPVEK
ncbi:KEOPS complex subunit Cgi121 [Haloarcula montana]|uniref:KEOPS complex subunit Cgi121 n=1 Tax=Haloarcula montana TaxID=3111776 RepID=UPI002D794022|nr:KEOPS complex subunit Cgi121 [Haloarcula sp. GH36]